MKCFQVCSPFQGWASSSPVCVSCICMAAVNYQAQFIGCFKHVEIDTLNSFFGGGGCSLWLTHPCFFEFVLQMCNSSGDLLVFLSTVEQGVVLNDQHLGRAGLCSCSERLHRCSLWAFNVQGDCTLLPIWQKPCIWKSLVWALWATIMRLWTWKSSICDQ